MGIIRVQVVVELLGPTGHERCADIAAVGQPLAHAEVVDHRERVVVAGAAASGFVTNTGGVGWEGSPSVLFGQKSNCRKKIGFLRRQIFLRVLERVGDRRVEGEGLCCWIVGRHLLEAARDAGGVFLDGRDGLEAQGGRWRILGWRPADILGVLREIRAAFVAVTVDFGVNRATAELLSAAAQAVVGFAVDPLHARIARREKGAGCQRCQQGGGGAAGIGWNGRAWHGGKCLYRINRVIAAPFVNTSFQDAILLPPIQLSARVGSVPTPQPGLPCPQSRSIQRVFSCRVVVARRSAFHWWQHRSTRR